MLTPQEVLDLRGKVLRNERISLDECKAFVEFKRAGRITAQEAAAASGKKKSTKKGMTDNELSNDIDSILAGIRSKSAGQGTAPTE